MSPRWTRPSAQHNGAPVDRWRDARALAGAPRQAAEVILSESLGYGTYSFTVSSPIGDLDPNVVLGLFTWSDDPAYHHREIDVANSPAGGSPADRPTPSTWFSQTLSRAACNALPNRRVPRRCTRSPGLAETSPSPAARPRTSRSPAGDTRAPAYPARVASARISTCGSTTAGRRSAARQSRSCSRTSRLLADRGSRQTGEVRPPRRGPSAGPSIARSLIT